MAVYEPSDDSFMLARTVKKFARGKVLDMGTGSGIQAETAALSKDVTSVLGVDIDREAIESCRKNIPNGIVSFMKSNLFSEVKEKFDTIIFNPPYLPKGHDGIEDLALIGGKRGWETIDSFIRTAGNYLNTNGKILLLFSSHTDKERVDQIIIENMFEAEEIARKRFFYEELFVYIIHRNEVMNDLEKLGITDISRFSRGKRGLIFTGMKKKQKVAIKVKNPVSKAIGRIEIEGRWLKAANKNNIGPILLHASPDFVVYKFIEGMMIEDFILSKHKKDIKMVLKRMLEQMRALDLMRVDKEEMHHPFKHIIVKKGNLPVLIDFERCHVSLKPKNVTQFCQYLTNSYISNLLAEEGIMIDRERLQSNARTYKGEQSDENFQVILDEIDNTVPKKSV